MSALLEIIAPSGEVQFVPITAARPLDVGRDPSNDIVLLGDNVPEFLAIVSLDIDGAHVIPLHDGGMVRIEGEPLRPEATGLVKLWQEFTASGYTLVLLPEETSSDETAKLKEGEEAAETTGEPGPVTALLTTGVTAVPGASIPAFTGVLPRETTDEWILTQLDLREWSIDVEQTATCEMTLVNGSDVVAAFEVIVQGLNPDWVRISPAQVNLNEAASTQVTISITPPREPASRAGVHPFAIIVRSETFSGRQAVHRCALTVGPYYAFDMGDIDPRQQSVSYRNNTAFSTVAITNLGNSTVGIRLDGKDDENGCFFEFEVPGREARLAKQAEFDLEPETQYTAPIYVSPFNRKVIGLRSKEYAFNITATLTAGTSTPRTVMGRLKAKPLIGPLIILLILLLTGGGLIYYLRPTPTPILTIAEASVLPEEAVELTYDANRFSGLSSVNPINRLAGFAVNLYLEFKGENDDWQTVLGPADFEAINGQLKTVPISNGRYRLRVESFVSSMVPSLSTFSSEIPVYITPVQPDVQIFEAAPATVSLGETVSIRWVVQDADTLSLIVNGSEESLQGDELSRGTRELTLDRTSTIELVATNPSWDEEVRKPLQITVEVPEPVIVQFDVSPLEITQGDTITIVWEVEGADSVDIDPLGTGLPLKGQMSAQPQALTTYRLSATFTGPDGTQASAESLLREIIVNPAPTATPVPVAPVIELFAATPNELVKGDATEIMLTWSVTGATTDIQITSPSATLTGLSATDSITMTVSDVTLFVLTAKNGDLSASTPLEVGGEDPTPTPEPTATATPTPLPAIISFFKAAGIDADASKVTFSGTTSTSSGPIYAYTIEAGAMVELSWDAANAETVELEGYGPQPASSTFEIPNAVVKSTTLTLTATNASGVSTKSYLRFNVEAPDPPPAPFNVTGKVVDSQAVLSWSYRTTDRAGITGFRIYRANLATDGIFIAVWTEYDPSATGWTDEEASPCDTAYYVVAVYDDIVTETEKETGASTTSWYSPSCP